MESGDRVLTRLALVGSLMRSAHPIPHAHLPDVLLSLIVA